MGDRLRDLVSSARAVKVPLRAASEEHEHQHLPSAEGIGLETFLSLMLYTPYQIMLGRKGEPDALCLHISCCWIAP